MGIKQKIKSAWDKVADKCKSKKSEKCGNGCGCGTGKRGGKTDSELGAEEVVEKEIYPPKKCCRKKACENSANKKPSKRTRPTNNNYNMIDKDNDTCDCGKS